MKWKEQIFTLANNIRKIIYMKGGLRDILKEKDLRLIYLTLVESIIAYRNIGWGGYFDNLLSRLQRT